MPLNVIFLSLPGLRDADLSRMPQLTALMSAGEKVPLTASFPCVTWPVQANVLTGKLPREHGVIANGFYWRDEQKVEMWTAWNDKITAPQIWDRLHEIDVRLTSAVWFPMLSKGCGADYVCMPAPIHNPDGSEDLWCYTKPTELYGELRDALGHFPLQHFWGPLANVKSSSWIAESCVVAAEKFRPRFTYIYLPHLDYAAQKSGPDSEAAINALAELDNVIGKLATGMARVYDDELVWMAASEYVITPVDHVVYPNRVLREAGLLRVREEQGLEYLDFAASDAWALVDHQFSHIFTRDDATAARVAELFRETAGIDEVLVGDQRAAYSLDHPRSGEVILISTTNSWQAYYWWHDDAKAPSFARTVDIHRKPGYDPVELHFDPTTKSIPLDATLVKGSHGAPPKSANEQGVLLTSKTGVTNAARLRDTDIAQLVLKQFTDR